MSLWGSCVDRTQLAIRPVGNNNNAKSLLLSVLRPASIMSHSLDDIHHLMSDRNHSRRETLTEEQGGRKSLLQNENVT